MSRGHGSLQRAVLRLLRAKGELTTVALTQGAFPVDSNTAAQKESVRRALRRLEEEGYVIRRGGEPHDAIRWIISEASARSKQRRRPMVKPSKPPEILRLLAFNLQAQAADPYHLVSSIESDSAMQELRQECEAAASVLLQVVGHLDGRLS